jgi:tetratricopeptide (TPR) repeat protein
LLPAAGEFRRFCGLFALLAAATLLAYHPAWRGGILWDDDAHLTSAALQPADGLRRIWLEIGATQQYYPVAHSAFWIFHQLWGDNPLGYHLVNVALHVFSACVLATILRRLAVPGATLAAVIFALHPVQVESVAWMTELKNTLSGAFYMTAALVYLEFDRTRERWRYWLALGLFVLALLTKTVTASLPAALLIVFWWQRGRIDWKRDVRPVVPFFALGAASGLFTAWVERTFIIGTVVSDYSLGLVERMLLASRAILFYLAKLVWPADLMFVYPRWTISASDVIQWLAPVAVVALFVALWVLRTRTRAPLAGFVFFVVTLVPALGFVDVFPFRYSFVADHFQYVASVGIIALAAAALARAVPGGRAWAATLAVIIGAPLAFLTWQQSHLYADATTLYRTTIAQNPSAWMAYNNLADIELRKPTPDYARAEADLVASLQLNPRNPEAHNNLGALRERLGRNDEAIAEYTEAVRLLPGYADAQENLGLALNAAGRHDDAILQLKSAIAKKSGNPFSHDALATSLLSVGRKDEAVAEYREALRLQPDFAKARSNLGVALEQLSRYDQAVAEYRVALQAMPGEPQVHDNLGRALLRLGKPDEAVRELQESIRLQPDSASAHYHLASAWQMQGRLDDAIREYEAALKTVAGAASAADVHNDLGVALAMRGRMREAIEQFNAALKIAPEHPDARKNLARALKK